MPFYYKNGSYTADEYECDDMEISLQKCRLITKVVLIRRTNTNAMIWKFYYKMPFYNTSCPYTADEYECDDIEILLQKCHFITQVVIIRRTNTNAMIWQFYYKSAVLLQKLSLYGGQIRMR